MKQWFPLANAGVERRLLYVGAVMVSILISLWRIQGVDLVNHDAVFYLQAALGDASSARQLHNWLFYPYLIRLLSEFSGVGLETAAYLINIALDALLVYAFLRVVELFGGNTRVLFWGAVVILSVPYLNENREEIIRGHGYWAVSMLALMFYVKLYRGFSWWNVVGWSLCMALATLFRIEGLVIAGIAPLGLLLNRDLGWRDRWSKVGRTYLPLALTGLALAVFALLYDPSQNRLGDMLAAPGELANVLANVVPHKAQMLRRFVFPLFSQDGALYSIYISLFFAVVIDFIESLSLVYFLVWLFRRYLPASGMIRDAVPIIAVFLSINFLILFHHALLNFVMVSRYTMMAAILLLLIVVFSIAELQRKQAVTKTRGSKITFYSLVFFILAMFVASLKFSPSSKAYILEAADWVTNNVEQSATVATDYQMERLRYYSNREREIQDWIAFAEIKRKVNSLQGYDYLLLRVKDGELGRRGMILVRKNKLLKVIEILDAKGSGYFVFKQ